MNSYRKEEIERNNFKISKYRSFSEEYFYNEGVGILLRYPINPSINSLLNLLDICRKVCYESNSKDIYRFRKAFDKYSRDQSLSFFNFNMLLTIITPFLYTKSTSDVYILNYLISLEQNDYQNALRIYNFTPQIMY